MIYNIGHHPDEFTPKQTTDDPFTLTVMLYSINDGRRTWHLFDRAGLFSSKQR
ncbi:hypothetical protein Hanom_Chr09g00828141 [Helianthus anomalus]|nr:hypothetical protein HanPSC8_Chr02g0070361 [Helianthus annuus]